MTPRLIMIGNHFVLFQKSETTNKCKNCLKYYKNITSHLEKCKSISGAKYHQQHRLNNDRKLKEHKMKKFKGICVFIHEYKSKFYVHDDSIDNEYFEYENWDSFIKYVCHLQHKNKTFVWFGGSREGFIDILHHFKNKTKKKFHSFLAKDTLYKLQWGNNNIWDPQLFLKGNFKDVIEDWSGESLRKTGIEQLKQLVNVIHNFMELCLEHMGANPVWYTTISKLGYEFWESLIRTKELIYLPTSDMMDFVHPYFARNEINPEIKPDYALDINSHYPASLGGCDLMRVEYPVGSHLVVKGKERVERFFNDGLIGFYRIRWRTPKNLKIAVLPRVAQGLKYDCSDGEGVHCSVDIQDAIKVGYKIEFGDECLIWRSSSSTVFTPFVNKFYEIKVNSKTKSEYLFAKNMLNCVSGKLNQNLPKTEQKLCKSQSDWLPFIQKYKLTDIAHQKNAKGFMEVILSGTDITKKEQPKYPNHLGAFFLAYSRRLVLIHICSVSPLLDQKLYSYFDTDGFHVTKKVYKKLKKTGMVNQEKLGYLKNEFGEGSKIKEEVILSKKRYALEIEKSDGTIIQKTTCSGIPKDKVKFEDFIRREKYIINWTTKVLQKDMTFKEVTRTSTLIKGTD